MRRLWSTMGLFAALLAHAGCKHDPILRPQKNAEEFRIPPDEPRYTNPSEPPKDTLNPDPGNKYKSGDSRGPGAPGSPGNPSGLRSPGRVGY